MWKTLMSVDRQLSEQLLVVEENGRVRLLKDIIGPYKIMKYEEDKYESNSNA